jgi:hypothetical protein
MISSDRQVYSTSSEKKPRSKRKGSWRKMAQGSHGGFVGSVWCRGLRANRVPQDFKLVCQSLCLTFDTHVRQLQTPEFVPENDNVTLQFLQRWLLFLYSPKIPLGNLLPV